MIDLTIAAEAAKRWEARRAQREQTCVKLESGGAALAEDPARLRLRMQRLSKAASQASATPAPSPTTETAFLASASLVQTVGLERVIGKPDFLGINFLELALAVSRFVARVNIRTSPARTEGFGTGFMVSPRLLLTNNHVLRSADAAVHSEVEFDYQYDRNGRFLPVVTYALEPATFFITSQPLDYTLVAVRQRSVDDRVDLALYGWSRLIEEQGKVTLGEALNIIQHPKGEAKQIVLRKNELVDLPDENFAHYVTDTEPGSSGSPVYNDQWEAVALHHSGVPRMKDGKYIDRNGKVWDGGDPDEIDWIANEGIRVSSLVRDIKKRPLESEQRRLRDELLSAAPPHPIELARLAADTRQPQREPVASKFSHGSPAAGSPAAAPGTPAPSSVTWTFPLQITVSLGAGPIGVEQKPAEQKVTAATEPSSSTATLRPAERPHQDMPAAIRDALTELESARTRPYYDEAKDTEARKSYYRGISATLSSRDLYDRLNRLVTDTHKHRLNYQPSTHLYPWVDLHEGDPRPFLKSIYSGREVDPREFIEGDFRIEQERQRVLETLLREAAPSPQAIQERLDFLEASMPYNCEHVVPQSWFGKREPMRGDLHHLFACESGCNSFRANIPYFDFPDFEEVVRNACGKREEGKFEPSSGKGVVARATLYFLLRYPKEIASSSKEYSEDRIAILKDWHRRYPVEPYEKHRNLAIFEKQGNRNPLIDFAEWVEQIDFFEGLDRGLETGPRPKRRRGSRVVPTVKVPSDTDGAPVFEGFAIEMASRGQAPHVKRVVAEVLSNGWNVRPFGDRDTDFEVWRESGALTIQEAWQKAYMLLTRPGVSYAEPLFVVSVTNPDAWRASPRGVTTEEAALRGLCAESEAVPESKDPEWSLKQTRVLEAWQQFPAGTRPAEGIVIGHPDTGYRRHPEIVESLLIERGYDFVDGDADAEDELVDGPLLNPGHGTGTASVIVSPRGVPQAHRSSPAVSGVAPGATLIPIRTGVSVITLISSFNLANAIEHAAGQGAHVISISMGGVFNWRLRQAVLYAQRRGVIVLAAAGNCVRFVVWPAAYDEVIAVAACNARLAIWRGSSRGKKVDVTAPGESVWRAQVKNDGESVVARGSGTSYAVATTAGIAALWLAKHGRQALVDRYGVEKLPFLFNHLLRTTCSPVSSWEPGKYGAGLVNAEKLLAAPLPDVIPSPAVEMEAHVELDKGNLATFTHLFESVLVQGPISAESAQPSAEAQVRKELAELLRVPEAKLREHLREVGQEVAFHLATDPELYRLFEQALGGRPVGVGQESMKTAANEQLRASLSRRGSERMRASLIE